MGRCSGDGKKAKASRTRGDTRSWGCTGTLTLLAGVRVRGQLHVVGWEKPHVAVGLPFPPVGVVPAEHGDELPLAEGQLVVVLRAVVVHADHLAHCGAQGSPGAAAIPSQEPPPCSSCVPKCHLPRAGTVFDGWDL